MSHITSLSPAQGCAPCTVICGLLSALFKSLPLISSPCHCFITHLSYLHHVIFTSFFLFVCFYGKCILQWTALCCCFGVLVLWFGATVPVKWQTAVRTCTPTTLDFTDKVTKHPLRSLQIAETTVLKKRLQVSWRSRGCLCVPVNSFRSIAYRVKLYFQSRNLCYFLSFIIVS